MTNRESEALDLEMSQPISLPRALKLSETQRLVLAAAQRRGGIRAGSYVKTGKHRYLQVRGSTITRLEKLGLIASDVYGVYFALV